MTHPSRDDIAGLQDAMPDEELLAAVRAGDTGAYAALYRRHSDAALAKARHLVGSHDGQDVAQEAFLKVLRAITGGGGPHDGFAPYLMRVVHNEAIDRLRRSREAAVEDLEAMEADAEPAAQVGSVDGGEQLDRDLMHKAFSALPAQWQRILWLTEVDGLAPREVAPQLHRSPNAVAQLSRRAREGLRTAWLQAHVDGAPGNPGCQQIAAELGAYERGQLSAARAARTAAHLEDCVRCSVALRDLRSLSTRMRGLLLPLVLGSPVLWKELAEVLPLPEQRVEPAMVPESAAAAESAAAEETWGAVQRPSWWRASTAALGVPAAAAGVAVLVGAAGILLVAQHPSADPGARIPAQEMASPRAVDPVLPGADDPATPTLLPVILEEDDTGDETPAAEESAPRTEEAADAAPAPAPGSGGDASRAEPAATSDPASGVEAPPAADASPTVDSPPAGDGPPPVEIPPAIGIPPSVEARPTPDLVLEPGVTPGPVGGSPSETVGDPTGDPQAPEVPDPPLLGGTPPGPPTPPPPPDPPLLGGGTPPWLPEDPTPPPEEPIPPIEGPTEEYAPGDGEELPGQDETPPEGETQP